MYTLSVCGDVHTNYCQSAMLKLEVLKIRLHR